MFFKRKKDRETAASSGSVGPAAASGGTVLGPGWTFTGRVYGKGHVAVQSVVEGEVDLQGTVTLGSQAMVKGMLRAEEVRLSGSFEGRLEGARLVALEETARLEGDVVTRRLEMAAGARLNGQVDMASLTHTFRGPAT